VVEAAPAPELVEAVERQAPQEAHVAELRTLEVRMTGL
jgi:hypothetical protein